MGTVRDEEFPEPPRLRRLRRLVTALTVTLIGGVIAIVALLVIRLSGAAAPPPAPGLPPAIRLPAGETAEAVTLGRGWVAVVTRDAAGRERVRVLDAATGAERGMAEIE